MGKQTKQTTAYFEQSERWVRVGNDGTQIGEPQEVNVVVKQITRNDFMITYLAELVGLIDTIGNKRMKVVKYILKNMDKSTNKLTQTESEIAEGCKVARKTVHDTLRMLQAAGFVTRKTGVVMLSPKIAHKGNAKKEQYLMTKFREMEGNENGND